jgi:uncharacterized protein (DUF427 family)
MDLMEPTTHQTHWPIKGDARYWSVKVGLDTTENAAWNYPVPIEGDGIVDVRNYVALYWNKMDAWFEDDIEVTRASSLLEQLQGGFQW